MTLLTDFKKFLLRGNVVDLAVAVVIGTAFAAVVKALVADLLTPIIALIFGKPNFGALSFTVNSSHFLYGDFVNNVITFLSIAAAVFFFVVAPVNRLMVRRREGFGKLSSHHAARSHRAGNFQEHLSLHCGGNGGRAATDGVFSQYQRTARLFLRGVRQRWRSDCHGRSHAGASGLDADVGAGGD